MGVVIVFLIEQFQIQRRRESPWVGVLEYVASTQFFVFNYIPVPGTMQVATVVPVALWW